jgi:hypothetical protein
LQLTTGPVRPWLLDQCEGLTPIEAKRQCRFNNLNEKLEGDFGRASGVVLRIDGVKFQNKVLINRSKPFIQALLQGLELHIDLIYFTRMRHE